MRQHSDKYVYNYFCYLSPRINTGTPVIKLQVAKLPRIRSHGLTIKETCTMSGRSSGHVWKFSRR